MPNPSYDPVQHYCKLLALSIHAQGLESRSDRPDFKKGDPSKVDNFRSITLQSVPYKIYSSFIRNRLQAFLDKNNYHNSSIQKGFAHGQDGIQEHTELLDYMMKDAKKHHRGYIAVLLDLRNAFGEIHHNLIRSSLR